MWLFHKNGFDSIVAYDPKKDYDGLFTQLISTADTHLLVRGRVKEDLEDMKRVIPTVAVESLNAADYLFRAVVSREDFKRYLCALVDELDYYSHFKEVTRANASMPEARYPAMVAVWSDMYKLQPAKSWPGYSGPGPTQKIPFSDKALGDLAVPDDGPITLADLREKLEQGDTLKIVERHRERFDDDALELFIRLQEYGITLAELVTVDDIESVLTTMQYDRDNPQEDV